jgi:hypothetical protein
MRVDVANCLTRVAWKLWSRWKYSGSMRLDPWKYALPVEFLTSAGLTSGDIELLIAGELLRTRDAHPMRSGRRLRNGSPNEAVVILTDKGASALEQSCLNEIRPHWDPERRVLSVDGDAIKVFRQPSENQESVLSAFQEDGWTDQIDDPLPRATGLGDRGAKIRLRKTVEHLNRAQRLPSLLFCATGNGERISWSFRLTGYSEMFPGAVMRRRQTLK